MILSFIFVCITAVLKSRYLQKHLRYCCCHDATHSCNNNTVMLQIYYPSENEKSHY